MGEAFRMFWETVRMALNTVQKLLSSANNGAEWLDESTGEFLDAARRNRALAAIEAEKQLLLTP